MRNLVAGVVIFAVVIALKPAALSAAERVDISRIVDKAAAESILGEAVRDPAPRNMEGGDGYYSKCNYYGATARRTLILRLFQGGAGFDAAKELEKVTASTGPARAIADLGDKAQVHSGPDSGLPVNVLMLYVVKGNSLVTVGLSGFDDETALEKAKDLAQKILARL